MVKLPLTIEHALLGFLREHPMHAYEIHQTLMRPAALGLVWHLKQSLVYVMLERLEEAGYITTTLEPRRSAFARWLVTPVEHGRDFWLEFLAKLYFANQNDSTVVATLLNTQRAACQKWLGDLGAQADLLAGERDYDWLVLQFRIGQIDAILSWLDTCEATVTALSIPS